MNHREILVDSLKKAIARGKKSAQISKESGVTTSVLSRIINGQQQDLMAGFYFSILDSLDEDIKQEAFAKLGIKTDLDPKELVNYLTGKDIVRIIPFLADNDTVEILAAIAKTLQNSREKISA
jgi:hypothetical protein